MKLLPSEVCFDEIKDNKVWLEGIIGKKIMKFAYPRGRYDYNVIKQVKKAGYEEARTTIVLKLATFDPLMTPTTIHVRQRDEYNGVDWLTLAKEYIERAYKDNGIFHLWGHSKEISKLRQWEKLEEFFQYITNNYFIKK